MDLSQRSKRVWWLLKVGSTKYYEKEFFLAIAEWKFISIKTNIINSCTPFFVGSKQGIIAINIGLQKAYIFSYGV